MEPVDLKDAAKLVSMSVPTFRNMVRGCPDFPVIERGVRGQPWKFDPEAVAGYVRTRQERLDQVADERHRARAELIGLSHVPGSRLSLDDELKAVNLRRLLAEEVKECRQLVPIADVISATERAFRLWDKMLDEAVMTAAASYNLPDAVVQGLRKGFAAAGQDFMSKIATLNGRDGPAEAQIELF